MAPQFQSSFIPKQNTLEKGFSHSANISLFGSISRLLFFVVFLGSLGMFGYKFMVKRNIDSLKLEIVEAEKGIDRSTIKEMSDFSEKVRAIDKILVNHQAVSNFLSLLGESSVTSLEFSDFTYSGLPDGSLEVVLKGRARDYASIALQEDVLSKEENIRTLSFGPMTLESTGTVAFSLRAVIEPRVTLYKLENSEQITQPIEESVDGEI